MKALNPEMITFTCAYTLLSICKLVEHDSEDIQFEYLNHGCIHLKPFTNPHSNEHYLDDTTSQLDSHIDRMSHTTFSEEDLQNVKRDLIVTKSITHAMQEYLRIKTDEADRIPLIIERFLDQIHNHLRTLSEENFVRLVPALIGLHLKGLIVYYSQLHEAETPEEIPTDGWYEEYRAGDTYQSDTEPEATTDYSRSFEESEVLRRQSSGCCWRR